MLVIVYVGLLAVTAIYNLIRSPLRLLASNHQEIRQITATLQDIDSRLTEISSLKLPAPTLPPKPVAEPNIVYESSDTVDVHRANRGFLEQGTWINNRGFSTHFPAVIATFRNKILRNREIGRLGHISAQLSFISYGETEFLVTNRVVWLGTDEFRVTFGINDPRSLVVAIFENHRLCAIQENTTDDYNNPTKTIPLSGDLHAVHVELISESDGKIVSKTALMLEIVSVPDDVRLERVLSWKRRKLAEIAQVGRALMERQSASPDTELEQDYLEWEEGAARFGMRHLGDSFLQRFRPPPYEPPPGTRSAFRQLAKATLEPVGVYNKTRAKVEMLERFKDEVV